MKIPTGAYWFFGGIILGIIIFFATKRKPGTSPKCNCSKVKNHFGGGTSVVHGLKDSIDSSICDTGKFCE